MHGRGTGRDGRDKQQAGDICMAGRPSRLVKGMQVEAGETDEAGEEAAGQVLDSWLAGEKGPAVVNFYSVVVSSQLFHLSLSGAKTRLCFIWADRPTSATCQVWTPAV